MARPFAAKAPGTHDRRDPHPLINRRVGVQNVQSAILHALSDNCLKRLDITAARELVCYQPQDDVAALNAHSAIADD